MNGPQTFTDHRIVLAPHLGTTALVVLLIAAVLAVLLSTLSLLDRGGRDRAPSLLGGRTGAVLLGALRALGVLLCLTVALQPRLEQREVTRVPNQVAVLVDTSRSMEVRPPDGGPGRAARAHGVLRDAAPLFDRWQREGHHVDLYAFGETLAPSSVAALAAPPAAEATRIGEALSELRARTAGHDLGAVIVISDGIDNGRVGEGPLDAETRKQLQALGAPVHAVGIGERGVRDLSVAAVLADEFAFVRTPVVIEAVLRQAGLPDRTVEVTLTIDGKPAAARTVTLRGDRSSERVAFDWVPDHPGQFVFRIDTPVLAGEALATNNSQVFTVRVIRDRVRVLHVCGRPSWDERFLRAMLRRDPNVDLVSFFILRTETDEQPWHRNELSLIPFPTWEIFDEQLHSFDLVIFQNFNFAPYGVEPFLPGLREYVQGGGAFAMVGGDLSFAAGGYGATPLRDVLPVELEAGNVGDAHLFSSDSYRPRLTPEARAHPITALALDGRENEQRWGRLPPLEGLNRITGVRPGATTLLVHPSTRLGGKPAPVLVAGDAGKGRALALLTDTAWHWGFLAAGAGDDGRAFQRFWENAIRWLVRDPALTLLRIDLDRAEYLRSQSPSVRVRTLRPDYTPAAGVQVTLELVRSEPADAAALRTMTLTSDERGEIHSELGQLAAGAYRLRGRATIAGTPANEEKLFSVRSEGRELEDVAYRPAVLRQLAEASGGSFQEGRLGDVTVREAREVRIGRRTSVDLWSSPILLAVGLLVLSLEWWLRRRAGFR